MLISMYTCYKALALVSIAINKRTCALCMSVLCLRMCRLQHAKILNSQHMYRFNLWCVQIKQKHKKKTRKPSINNRCVYIFEKINKLCCHKISNFPLTAQRFFFTENSVYSLKWNKAKQPTDQARIKALFFLFFSI